MDARTGGTAVSYTHLDVYKRQMQTDPDEQREAAAAIAHEGRRLESLSQKLLALLGLAECPLIPAAVPRAALWPRLHAACPGVNLRTPAAPAPTVQGDADLLLLSLIHISFLPPSQKRAGRFRAACARPHGCRRTGGVSPGCWRQNA